MPGLASSTGTTRSFEGSMVRIQFTGKSANALDIDLRDPRLVRLVGRCGERRLLRLLRHESDRPDLAAMPTRSRA